MAKLVDAPSSGGGAERCAGSNPVLGTLVEAVSIIRGSLFFSCGQIFLSVTAFGSIILPLNRLVNSVL